MNEGEPLLNQDAPERPPELQPPPPAPPEPERYPFWGYGDLFLFFGLAIPALLLGWLIIEGAFALFDVDLAARAVEPLAQQFAGYLILFGALMLMFRVQYGRPFWRSLAWFPTRMPVSWIVLSGLASAFTVALIGVLIRTPNTQNSLTELMEDRTSLLLMVAFGTTLGPLFEELAFRGFLQPVLVRSIGAAPGIIAAAIPFGLLHYHEYGDSWRHAVIVAAAGATFGWMRHVTGSTKAAAIMHAAYNALFFTAVLAQRKDLFN